MHVLTHAGKLDSLHNGRTKVGVLTLQEFLFNGCGFVRLEMALVLHDVWDFQVLVSVLL